MVLRMPIGPDVLVSDRVDGSGTLMAPWGILEALCIASRKGRVEETDELVRTHAETNRAEGVASNGIKYLLT